MISGAKNRQIAPENLVHKLHHSGGGGEGIIQKMTEGPKKDDVIYEQPLS